MNAKFNASLMHLAPILISLIFGVLCASLFLASPMEFYTVIPFPEDTFGSSGNACYFVVLVGVGASLLYLLLKRKNHKVINLITSLALTTAVFMLSFVYLFAAFSRFAVPHVEVLILTLSILITVLADLAIFRIHSRLYNMAILCLGGALGAFLGFSVPTLSTIWILAFLAIYDVFAVYHGPVGKIARSGLEQLRGLSFSFKDVQMGLGDLTFYSMLSGHMFINFGFVPCLASIMGILIGCLLSFKMLEKKGMFPGLPLPIAFGLTPLIVSLLLR